MRFLLPSLAMLLAAAGPTAVAAQTTASRGPIPITGTVPALCSTGLNNSGSGVFEVGVLTDVTTGLLREDLSAAPKILAGAFCSGPSNISVTATPLLSVNNLITSEGFSRTVNFTATAAGWTTTAASFTTGTATNPGATQLRPTPFQGDITVSIGAFTTGGGSALRLLADPTYQGSVTVTLAVAS